MSNTLTWKIWASTVWSWCLHYPQCLNNGLQPSIDEIIRAHQIYFEKLQFRSVSKSFCHCHLSIENLEIIMVGWHCSGIAVEGNVWVYNKPFYFAISYLLTKRAKTLFDSWTLTWSFGTCAISNNRSLPSYCTSVPPCDTQLTELR